MLAHDEVWTAIDHLAEKNGLSPSGLARRAGLDPTTFNKSKRFAADGRPRWPSTESISKILRATNTSIGQLFAHDGASVERTGSLSVPLLGEAHAGLDLLPQPGDDAIVLPHPPRIVSFPDQRHEPLFALSVIGDSMLPLYRSGDVLFVSPGAEVRPGHRVVVKLRSGDLLVKVLEDRSEDAIVLHAVSTEVADVAVSADDVEWVARIVYATQ